MSRLLRDPATWGMVALALVVGVALGLALLLAYLAAPLQANAQGERAAPLLQGDALLDIGVIKLDPQTGELHFVLTEPDYATPAPTIPVPTATPSATASPLPPTPTLTPSATPANPTPTPEGPTVTPGPPPTVTIEPKPPIEERCFGTVTADPRLNVRSGPGTTYDVLGTVSRGDTLAFEGRRVTDAGAAWYLIFWQPGVTGYVSADYIRLDPNAECSWQRTALGWTVTPGASRDALVLAGRELQAAGITPTATVTSDHETATVLHDNGWYVVVRLWTIFPGDCPDMSLPPATSARLRVAYLAGQHAGARFDAAQLTNECGWPSAAYLRDWLIAAVGECDARGWTCIPTVFNTGAPELDWLPVLRPALRLMREHHHLVGYNAYPYDAWRMLCEDSDPTSYTTFRWRRFADYVPPDELPRIYLTEAARGDGARSPSLEDVVCFAEAVEGEVVGVCFWYVGIPLVPWQAAAWNNEQLRIGARALAA